MPLDFFYIPRKFQKTRGLLTILGDMEGDDWPEKGHLVLLSFLLSLHSNLLPLQENLLIYFIKSFKFCSWFHSLSFWWSVNILNTLTTVWASYVNLEIHFFTPVKFSCKYVTFSGYKKLYLSSTDLKQIKK